MEGLIPLVYRAIVQYKADGGQRPVIGAWFNESPSASYTRLPGDSGRFQSSDLQLFLSDRGWTSTSSPSSMAMTSASQLVGSGAAQSSPLRRSASRRPAAA